MVCVVELANYVTLSNDVFYFMIVILLLIIFLVIIIILVVLIMIFLLILYHVITFYSGSSSSFLGILSSFPACLSSSSFWCYANVFCKTIFK